ncbi:MAG: STAS domain-containing protein [Actinomycetota bacterium]
MSATIGLAVPPAAADLMPEGIRVTAHDRPGALVIRVAGNLDVYTVPGFRRAVEPHLAGAGPVVVDLTAVRLLDSTGLGALVTVRNRLLDDGRRLGLACGRSARIIQVTGLWPTFVCATDLAAVLALLRGVT